MSNDETSLLRRLNALTEAALGTTDLAGMVQALADGMAPILGADACFITFWDAERGVAIPAAATAPYEESYRSFAVEPGEPSLTEAIAREGRTIAVEDTAASGYVSHRIAHEFSAGSFLGHPLSSDGKVLGAVILGFRSPRRFERGDIAASERGARFISFAAAKMRLLEEERQRSEELAVLNRIGLAINADRDLDRVIHTIFEQCRSVIDLDTFYVALYDEKNGELRFPLFYDGGELIAFAPRSIRDDPGMSGHIIDSGESLSIPDASAPEIQSLYRVVRAGGVPARAYIGVPLLYGDKALGVLSVQSRRANVYSAHHMRLLETIAAQSAIAIENARLYGELQLLSVTDGLTGAYNFRHMMELGPLEFAKATRYGHPLSVLFLDIDHFRDFNNRFGHATGNTVLKAVADRTRACIREIDLFVRFGGEEFVIVLPETPREEAAAVAERVRASVESLGVPAPGGGEGLRVTISLGVASVRPGMADFQQLLGAANAAERSAKENGRNRVEVAP